MNLFSKFSLKMLIIITAFLSNSLILHAAMNSIDKGKEHETGTSNSTLNHVSIEAVDEDINTLSGITKKVSQHFEMRKLLNYTVSAIDLKFMAESFLERFKEEQIIPFDVLDELLYACIKKFNELVGPLQQPNDVPFYPEVCDERKTLPARDNYICVIGDIHGSFHSLLKILNDLKAKGYLDDNFKIIKNDFHMVFTGDYADRGLYGAEVWYLLLKLKLTNWDNIFLLQGNHENVDINVTAGCSWNQTEFCPWSFKAEIAAKYGKDGLEWFNQWEGSLFRLYGYLPQKLSLRPGPDAKRLVFCHGGFPDGECSYDDKRKVHLEQGHSMHFVTCHIVSYNNIPIRLDYSWHDYLVADNTSEGKEATMTFVSRSVMSNKDFEQIVTDKDCIDAVWQQYTKKDLVETKSIGAVGRGHQHSEAGLKMWNASVNQLQDWRLIKSLANKATFLISEVDYPIFTLSTATEFGISDDVLYGLIKAGPDYTQWTLTPCLVEHKEGI